LQLAPNAEGEFLGDYEALIDGGTSANTLCAFFMQTVSSGTPTSIFFRGIVPTAPTASTAATIVPGSSPGALFALGASRNLYLHQPIGWVTVGGSILTASVTVDSAGNPSVFAVRTSHSHDLFRFTPSLGMTVGHA